jgi:hypothetical protein
VTINGAMEYDLVGEMQWTETFSSRRSERAALNLE